VEVFGQSVLVSQNFCPWPSVLREQSDEDEEEEAAGRRGVSKFERSQLKIFDRLAGCRSQMLAEPGKIDEVRRSVSHANQSRSICGGTVGARNTRGMQEKAAMRAT
jgi:hypothetical protein